MVSKNTFCLGVHNIVHSYRKRRAKGQLVNLLWVYIDTIIVNYLNVYFLIGKVRLFDGCIIYTVY